MLWDVNQAVEVAVVDSDRLFRDALAEVLARDGLSVVAAVAAAPDLEPLPWRSPDGPKLLIIDFSEGEEELKRFLARVTADVPGLKTVALFSSHAAERFRLAQDLGCSACLTKDVSLDSFQKYLRLVLSGERMFSFEFAKAALSEPAEGGADEARALACSLTARELTILQYLTQGASNKLIARNLGLSAATVKANVKTLLRKLHINNRTEAAAWAVREGLDQPKGTAAGGEGGDERGDHGDYSPPTPSGPPKDPFLGGPASARRGGPRRPLVSNGDGHRASWIPAATTLRALPHAPGISRT